MTIADTVIGLFREQVGELLFLQITGHRQNALDLFIQAHARDFSLIVAFAHQSIVLLDGKPSLSDEIGLLHGL